MRYPSKTGSFIMPVAGLEPARIAPHDFESCASANSATPATQYRQLFYHIINRHARENIYSP